MAIQNIFTDLLDILQLQRGFKNRLSEKKMQSCFTRIFNTKFRYPSNIYVGDKEPGDVGLKIDPKIDMHFFNRKSKFDF